MGCQRLVRIVGLERGVGVGTGVRRPTAHLDTVVVVVAWHSGSYRVGIGMARSWLSFRVLLHGRARGSRMRSGRSRSVVKTSQRWRPCRTASVTGTPRQSLPSRILEGPTSQRPQQVASTTLEPRTTARLGGDPRSGVRGSPRRVTIAHARRPYRVPQQKLVGPLASAMALVIGIKRPGIPTRPAHPAHDRSGREGELHPPRPP